MVGRWVGDRIRIQRLLACSIFEVRGDSLRQSETVAVVVVVVIRVDIVHECFTMTRYRTSLHDIGCTKCG